MKIKEKKNKIFKMAKPLNPKLRKKLYLLFRSRDPLGIDYFGFVLCRRKKIECLPRKPLSRNTILHIFIQICIE